MPPLIPKRVCILVTETQSEKDNVEKGVQDSISAESLLIAWKVRKGVGCLRMVAWIRMIMVAVQRECIIQAQRGQAQDSAGPPGGA